MNNDLCRMVGCDFPLFAFSHCRDVVVAVSRFGNKYLKTVADGDQPNNLLSLYECVC